MRNSVLSPYGMSVTVLFVMNAENRSMFFAHNRIVMLVYLEYNRYIVTYHSIYHVTHNNVIFLDEIANCTNSAEELLFLSMHVYVRSS